MNSIEYILLSYEKVVTEGIINTRKGEGCKGGNYKYKEGRGL
jgi:hypothetical protein